MEFFRKSNGPNLYLSGRGNRIVYLKKSRARREERSKECYSSEFQIQFNLAKKPVRSVWFQNWVLCVFFFGIKIWRRRKKSEGKTAADWKMRKINVIVLFVLSPISTPNWKHRSTETTYFYCCYICVCVLIMFKQFFF